MPYIHSSKVSKRRFSWCIYNIKRKIIYSSIQTTHTHKIFIDRCFMMCVHKPQNLQKLCLSRHMVHYYKESCPPTISIHYNERDSSLTPTAVPIYSKTDQLKRFGNTVAKITQSMSPAFEATFIPTRTHTHTHTHRDWGFER